MFGVVASVVDAILCLGFGLRFLKLKIRRLMATAEFDISVIGASVTCYIREWKRTNQLFYGLIATRTNLLKLQNHQNKQRSIFDHYLIFNFFDHGIPSCCCRTKFRTFPDLL
jgi:hypothetical protein